ncbi:MAG: CbiX/SirB N-terminal domain-containing protein [Burkholderiales bacterium]|nr:CbiX/SirB N-terminal domain-containing protein [Burkholderiales bacterium]
MQSDGLILFAHGARDPRWAAPFEAVAARIRAQRPQLQVQLAFLELMTPDLATAGATLAAAGCRRVQVLPMFLGTGGHLRRDLPPMVAQLQAQHPQVQWQLQAAVGEHPLVGEAMAAAALALLADASTAGQERA